jgi:ABC-type transport system substrate-binding protein
VVYEYTEDSDGTLAPISNKDLILIDDYYYIKSLIDLDRVIQFNQFVGFDLCQTTGNGYWCIDFNCGNNYPSNISGFRRAFAYAFNKTRVTTEFPAGLFNVHDSVVPETSSFCIESELDWHYYTDQSDIGNQILDDLGFSINSTTGWRDAPNGEPFSIAIDGESYTTYQPSSHLPIVNSIAQAAKDAFIELNVNAKHYGDYWPGGLPGSADLYVHDTYFQDDGIDWLGYDQSIRSFRNTTFDQYLDELLSGTSYDAVFEAGVEIQKNIHYNVPRLVVCSGLLIHPYSTRSFVGVIEDVMRGASGIWSLCNMRNKYPSSVDPVRIGFQSRIRSLNIFIDLTHQLRPFFENIWPTLFLIGPNLELIPNLATSMTSETHDDNPVVPEGHTRVIVDILPNATWSDGVPLTAEDVAYTVTYEYMSGAYGNPAALGLGDLFTAYAPTSTRVIFEYESESYWNQFKRATRYIIPKHIFDDEDGIGYEDWNTWNPLFDFDDPLVTCGPFVVDENSVIIDEEDEYLIELEMSLNPNYYYSARYLPENETETQSPTTTPRIQFPTTHLLLGFYASTLGCATIVLIIIIWKERTHRIE